MLLFIMPQHILLRGVCSVCHKFYISTQYGESALIRLKCGHKICTKCLRNYYMPKQPGIRYPVLYRQMHCGQCSKSRRHSTSRRYSLGMLGLMVFKYENRLHLSVFLLIALSRVAHPIPIF